MRKKFHPWCQKGDVSVGEEWKVLVPTANLRDRGQKEHLKKCFVLLLKAQLFRYNLSKEVKKGEEEAFPSHLYLGDL